MWYVRHCICRMCVTCVILYVVRVIFCRYHICYSICGTWVILYVVSVLIYMQNARWSITIWIRMIGKCRAGLTSGHKSINISMTSTGHCPHANTYKPISLRPHCVIFITAQLVSKKRIKLLTGRKEWHGIRLHFVNLHTESQPWPHIESLKDSGSSKYRETMGNGKGASISLT